MSCMPNRSEREKRLWRAFYHYVRRNHDLNPAGCDGCREAAAFLTIPGYEGDAEYPTCAEALLVRDERSGLKHTRGRKY